MTLLTQGIKVICCELALVSLLFCTSCMTSGEDLDENERFNVGLEQSTIIHSLEPIKNGETLYIHGGNGWGGAAVCYVLFVDNADPLAHGRSAFTAEDARMLVNEMQRISQKVGFTRSLELIDAFLPEQRIRFIIGPRGSYAKVVFPVRDGIGEGTGVRSGAVRSLGSSPDIGH